MRGGGGMGGGGRFLCSPYFVTASLLVLMIVSVKYFSLSSERDEILERMETVQQQLKKE